jgi:hypothetical protein
VSPPKLPPPISDDELVPWWEWREGKRPPGWPDEGRASRRYRSDDFNDIPDRSLLPRDHPGRIGLKDINDVRAPGADTVRISDVRSIPEPLPAAREGELPQLTIVTLDDFVAIQEPGADALVGDPDDALFPAGGDIMIYGDGGAARRRSRSTAAATLRPATTGLACPSRGPCACS